MRKCTRTTIGRRYSSSQYDSRETIRQTPPTDNAPPGYPHVAEVSVHPKVLVAAATGQGGVAEVISRVMPHLPNASRVDVSAWLSALSKTARAPYEVLHLHPSLRTRAVA